MTNTRKNQFSSIAARVGQLIAGLNNRRLVARCDARLKRALTELSRLPVDELRQETVVADIIRRAGLVCDRRNIYGRDEKYMNPIPRGLWQIPEQLAGFLVWLSSHRIRSFIEIGTHTGYTFAFAMTYLTRFNPDLEGVTVDVADNGPVRLESIGLFKAKYVRGTTESFSGQVFDLCLIDGDHSYRSVRADFERLGVSARICAFHDINDEIVEEWTENEGGVPRFWREVKGLASFESSKEFTFHSENRRVMGIGVLES